MNNYQNPLRLPGQWPEYGVGDPYVLCHNGRYYLYPSTPGEDQGVRVWGSCDMVNWEDMGFVTRDDCLKNAYAPEVFYYNGTFLLVASPFGEGHYLYASQNPIGPFHKVRDNFGLVIDGSLFADDDAQLYFTHAEYPAIHGHRMTPEGEIGPGRELIGTSMGHWTEGSMVFKRGGKYYITMTGNHLYSRGYRVQYAVSDSGPLGPYKVPGNKTILVNTDPETGSLGHSSTVIGPDLDSYWIFYHRFPIGKKGRRSGRYGNMDRMLFNGGKLLVSGPTNHPCEAPQMPDFYGWADEDAYRGKFIYDRDGVMSLQESPVDYTAEICLIPGPMASVIFGAGEHGQNQVRITPDKITLITLTGSQENVLWSGKLFDGFHPDVLHTIRLEARGGKMALYVDHMMQARHIPVAKTAGFIGAKGAARVSYMAFSRHVNQRGDYEHYHVIPGSIEAAMFLPLQYGGCSGGHQSADCGCRPEDGMQLTDGADGAPDLILGKDEFVMYRLNAAQAGRYRLQAVLQADTKSCIQASSSQDTLETSIQPTDGLQRMELGILALEKGMQTLCFLAKKGGSRLRLLELIPLCEKLRGGYSGLQLCREAYLLEGEGFLSRQEGLQMDRPVQSLARFGERFHTDAVIEADVIFRGDGAGSSAGLFLRLSENSYYPDQVLEGHRGYYIGFDMETVSIRRLDFGSTLLTSGRCPLCREQSYHMKAQIEDGKISVWLDGALLITARESDPLPYGCIGVGSLGARVTVTNVSFELE